MVDCVPAPLHATELHIANVDHSEENVIHIPNCIESQDISTMYFSDFEHTTFIEEPYCFDILYERTTRQSIPIVVYCKSMRDRPFELSTISATKRMLNISRCCSYDTVFNINKGKCEPRFDHVSNYSLSTIMQQGFLAEIILNVHRGMPNCSGSIFTYEIDVEDITLTQKHLQVTLPTDKNGRTESFTITKDNSCLELTTDSKTKGRLVVRVCRDTEFCWANGCINKCCTEGHFLNSRNCTRNYESVPEKNLYENLANITGRSLNAADYGLKSKLSCPNAKFELNLLEIKNITVEGYIQLAYDADDLKHNQYCIDVSRNGTGFETLSAFVCFPEEVQNITRFIITSILTGISCVFLLLTLIVYACLPSLQNLHGKTLMCHAASLFLAYLCLCMVSWLSPSKTMMENGYENLFCSALGFTMLFAFLSAFSWLNVMCFDIWRTFGRLQGNITRSRSHNKKFLLYCLYAWGLPIFITLFGILSDQLDFLPQNLRPDFGTTTCWFSTLPGFFGEMVFFTVPVAVQLTTNVVFFILTAEQCSKVKAEISRVVDPLDPRSRRFHADKTKFIMNVKLFVVMGISWIAEIVSSFVNRYSNYNWREELFYATDGINCLQGLLIFLLFVMKRRVHQALKKRLGFDTKKKSDSKGTSTIHDPCKMKKCASNSTLTCSFAVSGTP
ncbi:PREDICTED: G-protein coupled receptor Mth2-like [Habropoda laboriosa]|nr:PREDICTED: G-protein coupled receptor Mth2-like [Habropoda laboriosa]